jgi:hypothetical protein
MSRSGVSDWASPGVPTQDRRGRGHSPDHFGISSGGIVIILGLILIVVGVLIKIPILYTIGIILLVIGLILLLLGFAGRAVGGRRHYF